MKLIRNNSNSKPAFTIIELLTVMSIIIILIGLLVPALNRVKRYALTVKQRAQFHSISVALDLFHAEYEDYPDSNEADDLGVPYCGAMKLCEAMVGQDLKGFHPKSRFRVEQFVGPYTAATVNVRLYPRTPPLLTTDPLYPSYVQNLKSRKIYLELENANAHTLDDIYESSAITAVGFDPNTFVLCDVYNRVVSRKTGKKIGMPILYYRAETSNIRHVATTNKNELSLNIYDVRDNQDLIDLGMPWSSTFVHPLASGGTTSALHTIMDWPAKFYEITLDSKVPTKDRPVRPDSYILMSAGFDGEYGTSDDIYNFGE